MNQIFADEGLLDELARLTADDVIYHLFTNNVFPDRETVLLDLDEAIWSGYTAETIVAADWTVAGVAGHVGTTIAPVLAFANTSGVDQDAYGFYVTDNPATVLLFAARFDLAPITKPDGDFFSVVPAISISSAFAS